MNNSGRAKKGCIVALAVIIGFAVLLVALSFGFSRLIGWSVGKLEETQGRVAQVEVMPQPPAQEEVITPPPHIYQPPVYQEPAIASAVPETVWMESAIPVQTRDSTRVERKSDERIIIGFPDGETFDISAELGNIINSVEITEEVLED